MKKIFITKKIPPIAKELLSEHFQVDEYEKEGDISISELIKVVQNYDGMITLFNHQIDKNILSHAKRLRVIANYAIGLNNIDVGLAKKMGISVYNLPDIVTDSTADLTLALLLSLIRKICEARDYVLQDRWRSTNPLLFLGEELSGKTFGIIGFGRVGKAVAKRARAFGLNVVFHSRSKQKDPIAKQKSLEEVLHCSDYLSIHVPLTSETKGMIGQKEFQAMHKKPVLINMARGSVVDTQDLIKALEKGWVRSAALDVTDPEPISSDHPLCRFKNCLIVPHIGTSTKECRYEMAKKAAQNILMFFSSN